MSAWRERWEHLKVAFWEFVSPTWNHEDDPPDLEADTAARTEWVRKNRHPERGGRDGEPTASSEQAR